LWKIIIEKEFFRIFRNKTGGGICKNSSPKAQNDVGVNCGTSRAVPYAQ